MEDESGLTYTDLMIKKARDLVPRLSNWFRGASMPDDLPNFLSLSPRGEEPFDLVMNALPSDPKAREKGRRILASGVAKMLIETPDDVRTEGFYVNTLRLAVELSYPDILHQPLQGIKVKQGTVSSMLLQEAQRINTPPSSGKA